MDDLIRGVRSFHDDVYRKDPERYESLASGQAPAALFIGCSDSRVSPDVLTQADPGTLFVVRNAGNIVPPYGAARGGVGASIEYAVSVLRVEHVIVCGHTDCGVIKATLKPDSVRDLPNVRQWLEMTQPTLCMLKETHGDQDPHDLLDLAVEHHALMQIQNLQTHPSVAARLYAGTLQLHAWTYQIHTGRVLAYSTSARRFVPLEELPAAESGTVGRSGAFERPPLPRAR